DVGERRYVVVARRLDRAAEDVRVGRELARCNAGTKPLEERLVEPEPLEDVSRVAIDLDHERLRTGAASNEEYGARWTPLSVTIAETSAAGVTSKAGFRAGNRAETSRGSRSSIGMLAPVAAPGSRVDEGATTTNGISCCRATTASA